MSNSNDLTTFSSFVPNFDMIKNLSFTIRHNVNISLLFSSIFSFIHSSLDVNIQDMHGQTILHEVARDWSTDIAIYLLAKGAKCDVTDQYGRTPLFVAAASNHTKMIMWLVDVGGKMV